MITAGWGGADRTPGVPHRGAARCSPKPAAASRAAWPRRPGAGKSPAGNAYASGRVHAPGELAALPARPAPRTPPDADGILKAGPSAAS